MTARKSNSSKFTKTNAAVRVVTDAEMNEAKREQARQNFKAAYDTYLGSLGQAPLGGEPTSKTMFFGFLGSLATVVLGYAVGMQIAEWLALAAFWLTGWAYLAAAVYLVGIIIAAIASVYAAGRVARYIACGDYATDIEKVGGWFTQKFSDASSAAKQQMARVRGAA